MYYLHKTGREIRFGNERIEAWEDQNVGSLNETNAESELCSDSAADTEYHVLVKDSKKLYYISL